MLALRSSGTVQEPLERLLRDYITHVRAGGKSPKTVELYQNHLLRIFLPWARSQGLTSPDQLTSRTIDRFSEHLLTEGGSRGPLSKATVHSYLRTVNYFLSWARKEGEVGDAKAQLPRLPTRDIEVLSRDEIARLENTARNERDKLIIRVLADTGVRVAELCGLRTGDLLERDRRWYLRVRGKGDKDRLVPVPDLHRRLARFIRGRPVSLSSDRLFYALKRRAGSDELEPLTPSGVEQMLRLVARAAGLERRVYPHLLRHSFATWQLSRGMNPILLADLLGHSSLVMIHRVYAHLTPSDAYDAILSALRTERIA